MTCIELEVGDRLESTWTLEFTQNEQPADPPVVMFLVKSPDGVEHKSVLGLPSQPYPVSHLSAGVYRARVPIDQTGPAWFRRWVAFDESGSPMAADERTLLVKQSEFLQPLPT